MIDSDLERIKARAEALGLTLSGLCTEAGISRHTLNSWNVRRRKPSLDSLIKLNRVLQGRERMAAPTFATATHAE